MFRFIFPQRQYDIVITKNIFHNLIHFSEPFSPINGNYNIKTNCNNNLKCIKIFEK